MQMRTLNDFYVNSIPLIFFSFSLLKVVQEGLNYEIFPLRVLFLDLLNKSFLHGLKTFLSFLRGKEGIC